MNGRPPLPYRILERGESADGELYLRVEVRMLERRQVGLISMRDLSTAPTGPSRVCARHF